MKKADKVLCFYGIQNGFRNSKVGKSSFAQKQQKQQKLSNIRFSPHKMQRCLRQ